MTPLTAAAAAPSARARYARLLLTYLRPERRRVALLTILLCASIALELAGPQVLRVFIDAAVGGAGETTLLALAVLFIALAVLDQVLVGWGTYAGEDLGWVATNALRADLVRHCLTLDPAFHDRHTPGELIERIDGDVTALANFFSAFVLYILWGVLLTLGTLVLLFLEDWRVGLALTLFCAFALAVLHRLRHLATPAWGAERAAATHLFGFIEERLAGLADLHASGAQAYVLHRYQQLARRRFRRSRRATLLGSATLAVTGTLFLAGYVLALTLGATLFSAGAITLGTVYLIFHYTTMLRLPLELLSRQVQDFQKAAAGIARVEALTAVRPAISPTARPAPGPPARRAPAPMLPRGPLAVACQDVTFRYGASGPGDPAPGDPAPGDPAPGDPAPGDRTTGEAPPDSPATAGAVLRDVSFTLPAGRSLGVLGRTGSGKTTLARLLLRFYDPTAGSISLGEVDLRDVPPAAVQRRVGLVTQEVQLFRATVRDNLTLFDPAIPDARLLETVERLGLDAWLRALPAGLDTPLSGGQGLSAGQGQLLALARVFLHRPGLVVLDEASSRLDPVTEHLVQRALDRLLAGDGDADGAGRRTALVIAHRLATVRRVDDVLILEAGRVVEWGPRAALAADPGSRFARLLRAAEPAPGEPAPARPTGLLA